MIKLLNANLSRLFKGKLFYICILSAVAFALFEAISNALKPIEHNILAESPLFSESGIFLLILTAVFSGIFVGAEHDGALRNKIIAGKRRFEILLTQMISCSVATVLFHIVFIATVILTGLITGGRFLFSFGETMLYELLQLISLIEASVLFTMISLIIQHKSKGTVVSLLVLVLLFVLNPTPPRYSFEAYYQGIPMSQSEKQNISDNEKLLIGICEGIRDINPFGQQKQIKESYCNRLYYPAYTEYQKFSADNDVYTEIPVPVEITLFATGTIVAMTAVGVLVFCKKDIK